MGYVKYETKSAVAVVTIDREKALNTSNAEVLGDLKATFEGIDTETVRCVIMTGAGKKPFVAGADIVAISGMDVQDGRAFDKKGNDIFHMVETSSLSAITAVNGFAFGSGCELVVSRDFRIYARQVVFGQPEVGLGITPGPGGIQRLTCLVGPGMVKQLIYTVENTKATEALRTGLVNVVYPTEELATATERLVGQIAVNMPITVRTYRKITDEGLEQPTEEVIVIEEKLFSSCFAIEDQKTGMRAFLEKRKSVSFQNR